jgi:hypothetical protein
MQRTRASEKTGVEASTCIELAISYIFAQLQQSDYGGWHIHLDGIKTMTGTLGIHDN